MFDLEGYASVWHLVSTVCGELRPGPDAVDLLHLLPWRLGHRGCPKIRAMGIIEDSSRYVGASTAARSAP